MNWIKVKGSDPAVKELRKVFPEYKGRTFTIEVEEAIHMDGLYSGGGTFSQYIAVNMATGESRESTFHLTHAPWSIPAEMVNPKVPIPRGTVIVEWMRFCGKDMGLRFHVHPLDLWPALTA